jgi:predicted DsbA family dithiol-disulfide isomerase
MPVDVYFDVTCPWCWLGKRRFERALAMRPGITPLVRWRMFQLHPGLPADGVDRFAFAVSRFGNIQRVVEMDAHVADAALGEGIAIRPSSVLRVPNTTDAHRLIMLAVGSGLAPEPLIEMLFTAHFIEGLDLGDRAVLAALGARRGLDPGIVRRHLDGSADIATLRQADRAARRAGIHAVPCFVFDGRYAISGAQDPVAFLPLVELIGIEAVTSRLRREVDAIALDRTG